MAVRILGFTVDAVHTNTKTDWVFLHVLTDCTPSIRGLGEIRSGGAATGNFCAAALACLAAVEAQVVGRDPRNVEQIVGALLAVQAPPAYGEGERATKVWRVAVSALESALFDIAGKLAGLPIYQVRKTPNWSRTWVNCSLV